MRSHYDKLNVLTRAQIIDDTFHFLMSGQLEPYIFQDVLLYLSEDTDYIAWYAMFKNLEHMSGFFAFPSKSASIKV